MRHIAFLSGALALMGLAACSGDELLSGAPAIEGTPVQARVTVTMPAPEGDGTRSELNEVENASGKGILEFKFSDGDRVLVTNARGQSLGILSVPKGKGGKNTAEFTGAVVLPQGSTPIHGIYLGTGRNPSDFATAAVEQNIPLALAEQDGTAASLSRHDLLTAEATATRVGQASNFTLNLQRRMSFAHKRLKFPAGTRLDGIGAVTVSGLSANRQLGMASLAVTDAPGAASPITVRFPEGAAVTGHQDAVGDTPAYEYIDLYYATCPGQAEVTFRATVGGAVWGRTAPAFDYRPNILYSSAYRRGNTVTLEPQEDPWVECWTEEQLLAALDPVRAGTLNPRIKLEGNVEFALPESLEGFQSVTIVGDGAQDADGKWENTLKTPAKVDNGLAEGSLIDNVKMDISRVNLELPTEGISYPFEYSDSTVADLFEDNAELNLHDCYITGANTEWWEKKVVVKNCTWDFTGAAYRADLTYGTFDFGRDLEMINCTFKSAHAPVFQFYAPMPDWGTLPRFVCQVSITGCRFEYTGDAADAYVLELNPKYLRTGDNADLVTVHFKQCDNEGFAGLWTFGGYSSSDSEKDCIVVMENYETKWPSSY